MTVARSRVVVVDDHPLVRIGVKAELERAGLAVMLADLRPPPAELAQWIVHQQPDCVIVDLGLPYDGGGLALVEPVAEAGVGVAVLTGESDRSLWAECIRAGARVVLSKSEPMGEIVEVVQQLCDGQLVRPQQRSELAALYQRLARDREQRLARFGALSRREQEVLAGLMEGHGPAELAERDFVSIETVRTQIKSVLRKLDARSQLEAVAKAHASGWQRC